MVKHKIYYFFTLWFLISQIFPPYFYFVNMGGALTLTIYVVGSLLLFFDLLSHKTILTLLLLVFINFAYYLSGNAFFDEIGSVVVPFLCMMSSLIINEYALTYDYNGKFTKMVVLTAILLNFIMAIISIPQLQINPNLIRLRSGIITLTYESYLYTNYGTIHGLSFLIAPFVFLCRISRKYNLVEFSIYLFILTTFLILLIMSNAATAVLLSILMLVVAFLYKNERFTIKSSLLFFMVFMIGLLILDKSAIILVLDTAMNNLDQSGVLHRRLFELKDAIVYGEVSGDLGERTELYNLSQKLFFESPLFGTQKPELISNHTWIWDRLALYGLFFIWPVIALFYLHMKKNYMSLNHSRVSYTFGCIAVFCMLYFKNDFNMGTWLYAFALLPLMCRYADKLIEQRKPFQ